MEIVRVGVIGAGTMGSGIAQVCATAKYQVVLTDVDQRQLEQAMRVIEDSMNRFAKKGKLAEDISTVMKRITLSQSLSACAESDFVIEAIFEDLTLKTNTFKELSRHVSSTAILATNTSAISITAIAASASNPERVVGIHFFNPVPMLNAVEVIRGLETSDETLNGAVRFVESLNKRPIIVNHDIPGFLLNRINLPSNLEAIRMVEKGISSIEDIDMGMKMAFGRPMGIFELSDLVGLDVTLAACDAIWAETKDPKYFPPVLLRRMVKAGRRGKKSGKGWYEYNPDGTKKL